ncbi:MAG: GNAT family N-acetyltransferase [Flavobacteriaceae bacterium]
MEVQIRKATKQDSPFILALIQELATFEREPYAVLVTLTDIENHGFGNAPLFECLVAEVDQKVVGMALYYPRYSTWKGPTLHLEDLIVTKKMKGKGIGSKLYYQFIEQAYGQGVERIEWNVLDWNTPAISFYEKSGASVLSDWRTVQMHRNEMEQFLNNKKINENI